MVSAPASLWPTELGPKVLSPFTILKLQADALTRQTNGLLVGEIRTTIEDDDQKRRTKHTLDVVVPQLKHYRHRVLMAGHDESMVYPVIVEAEIFRMSIGQFWGITHKAAQMAMSGILTRIDENSEQEKPKNRADTDQEFILLVQKVLQSSAVKSAAQSLIALANDAIAAAELAAKANGETEAAASSQVLANDKQNLGNQEIPPGEKVPE